MQLSRNILFFQRNQALVLQATHFPAPVPSASFTFSLLFFERLKPQDVHLQENESSNRFS
jgi:hypothetical protein